MAGTASPSTEARPAPVLFVLLMPWGRVGSHLVASAFDNTPRIRVENEPTTAIRTHGHKAGLTLEAIRDQQVRHLEKFVARHPPGRRGAGLKLSFRSLVDQPDYLRRLHGHEFRLILMVRRNFLKTAISQMRALARAGEASRDGTWASPWAVTVDEPKPGPEFIDAAEAVRLAGVFKSIHKRMMKAVQEVYGTDWKSVEYERLSADPDATIRDLFTYLDLQAPEVIPLRHRKATSERLQDDILNYEEVAAAVKAAGLAEYL